MTWSLCLRHLEISITITGANGLKTQGISTITDAFAQSPEAMVSVRSKDRFVVMAIEHHHYPREYELTAAGAESQAALGAGRVVAIKKSPQSLGASRLQQTAQTASSG